MSMLALGIGPGDEVILPSFTFPSTANAIVLRGAVPVFADVEESTLTLDPLDVARRVTPRTRAIMPVHYAGVACQMDGLLEIARTSELFVVEDAAQGFGATWRGEHLGTLGDVGCYSFHATKTVTCGEGGAFVTNDDEIAARAEIIREKGTNRAAFFRGEVDKYTWVGQGSSYVLSDVLAAVLEAQLGRMEAIEAARAEVYATYMEGLHPLADEGLLVLPYTPEHCVSNHHFFHLRVASEETRNRCLHELKKQKIRATFHYIPLHSSPQGRRGKECVEELPVTDRVSHTLIRLPTYPDLDRSDQIRVIDALAEILHSFGEEVA
jgi:dTDP-4-amino-4,6-dideoxygalactose transaminase